MAKVPAAVPTHGLDAALAAVGQVPASGVANAEHVPNVLARMNQAPYPGRAATNLKLAGGPPADTWRQGSLQAQGVPHA